MNQALLSVPFQAVEPSRPEAIREIRGKNRLATEFIKALEPCKRVSNCNENSLNLWRQIFKPQITRMGTDVLEGMKSASADRLPSSAEHQTLFTEIKRS